MEYTRKKTKSSVRFFGHYTSVSRKPIVITASFHCPNSKKTQRKSWIMAQFCTRTFSEARPTSRCPSYSPSPYASLDFQYKCWYLISKVSLWGLPTPQNHQKFSLRHSGEEKCVPAFLNQSLVPRLASLPGSWWGWRQAISLRWGQWYE